MERIAVKIPLARLMVAFKMEFRKPEVNSVAPECKPDHAVCRRMEIYDINEKVFR